jgi:hypothetical protein
MDRKQLESAAANNHYLRGLLAVPVGVLWVFTGLANMGWGPFRQHWVFPVAVLMAGAAFLLVTRYYNDNYGRVALQVSPARAIGGSILSVLVMGGGPVLVQVLDLPVNGLAASFALVALVYYAVSSGLRAHHVVIWGAVLVASLIPRWGDPATTNVMNAGFVAVGAAAIATGIFDHRRLVRTFGSARDLNRENSHAGT